MKIVTPSSHLQVIHLEKGLETGNNRLYRMSEKAPQSIESYQQQFEERGDIFFEEKNAHYQSTPDGLKILYLNDDQESQELLLDWGTAQEKGLTPKIPATKPPEKKIASPNLLKEGYVTYKGKEYQYEPDNKQGLLWLKRKKENGQTDRLNISFKEAQQLGLELKPQSQLVDMESFKEKKELLTLEEAATLENQYRKAKEKHRILKQKIQERRRKKLPVVQDQKQINEIERSLEELEQNIQKKYHAFFEKGALIYEGRMAGDSYLVTDVKPHNKYFSLENIDTGLTIPLSARDLAPNGEIKKSSMERKMKVAEEKFEKRQEEQQNKEEAEKKKAAEQAEKQKKLEQFEKLDQDEKFVFEGTEQTVIGNNGRALRIKDEEGNTRQVLIEHIQERYTADPEKTFIVTPS